MNLEEIIKDYPILGTNKTLKKHKIGFQRLKKIVEDNNLHKNSSVNFSKVEIIEDKVTAYVLGLLWSDGFMSKTRNFLGIECLQSDMVCFKNVLDRFANWSYYTRKREHNIMVNAALSDKRFHRFLSDNDYLEKSYKSPNKIISKIPTYLISYFFLGIVDGDGCFYFNKKNYIRHFVITSTLEQDWTSIEQILLDIGVSFKIIKRDSKTKYSQIRVTNKSDISKIGNFIYSGIETDNIGLRRKFEKYLTIVE